MTREPQIGNKLSPSRLLSSWLLGCSWESHIDIWPGRDTGCSQGVTQLSAISSGVRNIYCPRATNLDVLDVREEFFLILPELCCTEYDGDVGLALDALHEVPLQEGVLVRDHLEEVLQEGVGRHRGEVPLQPRKDHKLHLLQEEK